jgi:hypothetical protein
MEDTAIKIKYSELKLKNTKYFNIASSLLIFKIAVKKYLLNILNFKTYFDKKNKLQSLNYRYQHFKITGQQYIGTSKIILEIVVRSKEAIIIINEYLNRKHYYFKKGKNKIEVPINMLEQGENILAYKGKIKIKYLSFYKSKYHDKLDIPDNNALSINYGDHYLQAAVQYLHNSLVKYPLNSPFRNSCYTIYDYDNECFRMSYWLWCDAPIVYAFLKLSEKDSFNKSLYVSLASKIGDTLLRNSIEDKKDKNYGALVSRYKYSGGTDNSFDCLLGVNDTSFVVKWALLPLYVYSGLDKYLTASEIALNWVVKAIYENKFVPSHFYYEKNKWEDGCFIDTGFTSEGLAEYNKIFINKKNEVYNNAIDFFMNRFLKQFQLRNGFYGQNYSIEKGVTSTLFTRGLGWVIEGLVASYKETKNNDYLDAATRLGELLIAEQEPDGSWALLLGNVYPQKSVKNYSGICEKATALLGYLFIELYKLTNNEKYIQCSKKAVGWCERNMCLESGQGYGGIASKNLRSGIIGLPFIKTATAYANAFYIISKLMLEELDVL